MRVILLKDVPGLGKRDDIKDVKDGYGRNFLIRDKLAEILTPQITNRLQMEKSQDEKAAGALKEKTLAVKEKIEKLNLAIKTKIGEAGQVFGSVTPVKIIAELEKHDIRIEKEQILSEPIKTLGEHEIKIKLPQGIGAVLVIKIEAETKSK
jgi:large subunit ribosomal protein L9